MLVTKKCRRPLICVFECGVVTWLVSLSKVYQPSLSVTLALHFASPPSFSQEARTKIIMMMMMFRRQAAAAAATRCGSTTTTSSHCCVLKSRSFQTTVLGKGSAAPSSVSALLLSSSSSLSSSSVLSSPSSRHRCSFSSSATTTSASDTLLDLLTREHEEEIQNSTNVNSELQELHDDLVTNQGWKIVSDRAMSRMMKTITSSTSKRLKIQITFHCQDMVEIASNPYEADEEPAEQEEEEDAALPVKFTVTVTNPGGNNIMVFTCLSENATLQIQSVAMTTSSNSNSGSGADSVDEMLTASDYQGPEFNELAQDIQDSFFIYLQETCGINEDVVTFIAMQSDYQEQTCYVKFLQDASNLLK